MTGKAIVVILAAAAMASGQPPEGKRRQRVEPPGGISAGAMAYNGLGMVRLLEVPDIQVDLKLTPQDKASLPLLREEMTQNSIPFEKALRESAGDRSALVATLMARSKEVDQQMAEVLGDKFQRFQQLRRQAFGIMAAATADAPVREGLGITEDQRLKFNAARKQMIEEMRKKWDEGGGKSRTKTLDLGTRQFFLAEEKLFKDLLTDIQREKWTQLLGVQIVMPDEVVRFIRRGDFGPRTPDGPTRRTAKRRKRFDGTPPAGDVEKKPPG